MSTLEVTGAVDADACADVLSRAFVSEPGMVWLCGAGVPRKRAWFAATGRLLAALPGAARYAVFADGRAVAAALVSPPDAVPGRRAQLAWTAAVARRCGIGAVRRTLAYLGAADRHKPAGAWGLEFIGVVPQARGTGAARLLIEHVLRDLAGADIFLTTADPLNIGLYRRFGFVETAHFNVDSVPVTAMCRPGVAPAGSGS